MEIDGLVSGVSSWEVTKTFACATRGPEKKRLFAFLASVSHKVNSLEKRARTEARYFD